MVDSLNLLSSIRTPHLPSCRLWVQQKEQKRRRSWIHAPFLHRYSVCLHCSKGDDKQPENVPQGLQWSDFNLFTWFDAPPEVIRVLAEEERRVEEAANDGWGSGEWEEDWVDGEPVKTREKQRRSKAARDSWLKPTMDTSDFWDKMVFNEGEAQKRLEGEWLRNQKESRVALKFLAFLVSVPLLTGFVISRSLSGPIWDSALYFNEHVFDTTTQQKLAGAKEIHKEELQIEMTLAFEDVEPMPADEMMILLSKKACELNEEFKQNNKGAMLNVVSDSISALVLFIIVLYSNEGMEALFSTGGRIFGGLSDTAKAFLIILVADILLGYHSEEGWTAALRLIASHYGDEPEDDAVSIVVATLPVFLDTCFKYWIFKGLNRRSPAAAVTLRTMNRH